MSTIFSGIGDRFSVVLQLCLTRKLPMLGNGILPLQCLKKVHINLHLP